MQLIMSLVGVVTIFVLAFLLSANRAAINRRTLLIAFSLQAAVAAFVLYVPVGGRFLDRVVRGVQFVIDQGRYGIEFVFGSQIESTLGFTIAFGVLPVIVFFAALMSVLYYLNIMQRVVGTFGGWLHKLLGTSHAESVSAVSNIFVGHTDAPLVVRPYLKNMTESELFAVMTGGCATIAGAVMMGYAQMGVDLKYLITASFMAAPGGLMMAKILMPETVPHDARPEPEQVGEIPAALVGHQRNRPAEQRERDLPAVAAAAVAGTMDEPGLNDRAATASGVNSSQLGRTSVAAPAAAPARADRIPTRHGETAFQAADQRAS